MTSETELLRRQCGVITRAQAVAAGRTPDEVDRLVTRRRWVPVLPRVYREVGHPDGPEARVWAAVSWAGDGSALSGLAAAWWHGLVPGPAPGPVPGIESAPVALGQHAITVTVARPRAPRSRVGVTVRRRDLDPRDRVVVRGLSVTGRELSVLDAALELGAAGAPFLDRLVGTAAPMAGGRARGDTPGPVARPAPRGEAPGLVRVGGCAARPAPGGGARQGRGDGARVELAGLAEVYVRTLGRRGTVGGQALLVAAAERSAAAARQRVVRALTAARVGGWRVDHGVAGLTVALAFPQVGLAVEVADPVGVLDPERAERGRWRQGVLARAGWRVLDYAAAEPAGAVIARIVGSARRAS